MNPLPPPEWKFLQFLQKWDALVAKDGKSCESGEIGHSESIWAAFWGKRWENMQNDQNWPFWVNLSHIFGKICHCGLFWATLVWNHSKKLKTFADVPPRNKSFWNFFKNEMIWLQKMGKVVNRVKLAILSQSEPHFGEKMRKAAKWPKLVVLSQSKPPFWQNLPLWVILSCFGVKGFEKVEKLKIFADVSPHKDWKKISQKFNVGFWIMFNFWWLVEWSEWQKLTKIW